MWSFIDCFLDTYLKLKSTSTWEYTFAFSKSYSFHALCIMKSVYNGNFEPICVSLLFPAYFGLLSLPPFSMNVKSPRRGEMKQLNWHIFGNRSKWASISISEDNTCLKTGPKLLPDGSRAEINRLTTQRALTENSLLSSQFSLLHNLHSNEINFAYAYTCLRLSIYFR